MQIKTRRTMIRSLSPGDWKTMQAIAGDFYRSAYAFYDRPLPTEEAAIRELTKRFAESGLCFSVTLADSGEMIGFVCFHEDQEALDMGYCFRSAYQGKGYAVESCTALMDFLAQRRNVRCFTAGTALENIPSRRLLEKLGFELRQVEKLSFHAGIIFEGGIFVRPMEQLTNKASQAMHEKEKGDAVYETGAL